MLAIRRQNGVVLTPRDGSMKGLTLESAGLTDVGRRRDHNEDAWDSDVPTTDDAKGALFAVADGVGGHAAGELASGRAIEVLFREYRSAPTNDVVESLAVGFDAANREVIKEGEGDAPSDQSHRRRASTLVAAAIVGDTLFVAHVGDSRAYLIRGGTIRQITRDHTLAMEWVRQGRMSVEEAERTPQNNVITRAIGRTSDLGLEFAPQERLEPGDRILLCSDGLTKHVPMVEVGSLASAASPSEACQMLIDRANERGGSDNITVVIVNIGPPLPDTEPRLKLIAGESPVPVGNGDADPTTASAPEVVQTGSTVRMSALPPSQDSQPNAPVAPTAPLPLVGSKDGTADLGAGHVPNRNSVATPHSARRRRRFVIATIAVLMLLACGVVVGGAIWAAGNSSFLSQFMPK